MATRYMEPLEISTERVDVWFEKFEYHLIELELERQKFIILSLQSMYIIFKHISAT